MLNMKRPIINLIVDACAFVTLAMMISTGFVLKFVLPPGSGRLLGEGVGRNSAQKPITLLWGLTRHEWGEVHFWVSIALMTILALHIFLHWRWVASMLRNQPEQHSGTRFGLGVMGLLTVIVFASAPFLSPKKTVPRYRVIDEAAEVLPSIRLRNTLHIRGSMTLQDVETQTGTPVAVLLKELNLPPNISPDSHIGRLSHLYGFDVEEIHAIVDRYEE
jgi:hypothetical protein